MFLIVRAWRCRFLEFHGPWLRVMDHAKLLQSIGTQGRWTTRSCDIYIYIYIYMFYTLFVWLQYSVCVLFVVFARHKMLSDIAIRRCSRYILATRLCNTGQPESPFFDPPPSPQINVDGNFCLQKRAISEPAAWPKTADPAAPKSTPKSMSSRSLFHQH